MGTLPTKSNSCDAGSSRIRSTSTSQGPSVVKGSTNVATWPTLAPRPPKLPVNATTNLQHTTLNTVVNTIQGHRGMMTPAPLFDGQLLRGHGRGTDVLPASDPSHQHPSHGRRQPHPDVTDATLARQHGRPDVRSSLPLGRSTSTARRWAAASCVVLKLNWRAHAGLGAAAFCRGRVLHVSLLLIVVTALHMLLSWGRFQVLNMLELACVNV
ncbi:Aste57867_19495 [Aphanomyces stellatus]|uniref:Aste57867_19495 protein n=1 Tax=Aphanomyces stellatus TaxID=120398 RepID=A0A485LDH2_9STRA|nr:hypothetical protein As57867_019431 [Aphanomyces stellatus]VFT96206.1 Aste57867_19495 [Aphanomyces stellatus]